MTKILIADSHFLVREGLKTILSSNYGFEVIAETEHYEKVMDLVMLADKLNAKVVLALDPSK
jgi:DNA-binding NarL/FixJ family response regulator